jgi:hypothetical protein
VAGAAGPGCWRFSSWLARRSPPLEQHLDLAPPEPERRAFTTAEAEAWKIAVCEPVDHGRVRHAKPFADLACV